MKGVFCVLVLSFFLAVVKADADTCFANPPVIGFGGSCQDSAGLNCQLGSYCGDTGVCTAWPSVGGSCYSVKSGTTPCSLESTCQGDTDQVDTLTCIQYAFAGEGCASGGDSFVPQCGGGLHCVNSRCVGASVGDSCYADSDCLSDSCVNLRCAPIADGKNCSDQSSFNARYECTPGLSYCALSTTAGVNGTCKAKQTSGTCTDDYQCKFGYGCVPTSTADDSKASCTQWGTVKAGDVCWSSDYCESKRCVFRGGLNWGYCAASRVQYCNLDSGNEQCASDETCACNGQDYDSGLVGGLNYGTCQSNPCPAAYQDLLSCTDAKCGAVTFYNGSCVYMNCYSQYQKAFYTCNSASGLSASFLMVSVMALAVSFFSKRF